jgi:hypothetical protein
MDASPAEPWRRGHCPSLKTASRPNASDDLTLDNITACRTECLVALELNLGYLELNGPVGEEATFAKRLW